VSRILSTRLGSSSATAVTAPGGMTAGSWAGGSGSSVGSAGHVHGLYHESHGAQKGAGVGPAERRGETAPHSPGNGAARVCRSHFRSSIKAFARWRWVSPAFCSCADAAYDK
jgi:hypothetical protein